MSASLRLLIRGDIDCVEIGFVERERLRNSVGKFRARGRFMAFDLLSFARAFVKSAGDWEPSKILVVVEDLEAPLREPVELRREIAFPLARVVV